MCAISGAEVSLDSCAFEDNQSADFVRFGRALLSRDSEVSVASSTFLNHSSSQTDDESGGAVAALGGKLTLRSSRFENNSTRGDGGSVFCAGCELVVQGSRFTGNVGGANRSMVGGGAIAAVEGSSLLLVDSYFDANTGYRPGGAVAVSSCSLAIYNSRFLNNSTPDRVGFGGAIFAEGSDVAVTGSLFEGNTAGEPAGVSVSGGGAVALSGGGGSFVNSTFVNNGVLPGSNYGGGALLVRSNAIAQVRNSLFWNNMSDDGDDAYAESGSLLTVESSTFSSEGSCFPSEFECPIVDPLFLDIVGGDFTPTNPVCIDTGNIAALPADTGDLDQDGDTEEALPLDILGNQRVQGSSVDLGAIEAR